MNTSPHILMCPPTYYGIEYEINPWMNVRRSVDHSLAEQQWHTLHETLVDLGVAVSLLDPVPGLPDMVFTANAALIYRERALLSRFRHPQRQGELPHNLDWFRHNHLRTTVPPCVVCFEGAGDCLFCGVALFAGYRIRTDMQGLDWVNREIGCRLLPLELVDSYYYHLDTCFCPLDATTAMYYPAAFDDYGRQVLRAWVPHLIEVDEAEAHEFACNAVVVGRRVITNSGCNDTHAKLIDAGFDPIATPLSEFVKAGGSAKCLTLRLDGEEAAAWRCHDTTLTASIDEAI